MTQAKRRQQKRTKEIKIEAAKKVVEQGEQQAAVARNLRVTAGQIHRWVVDYKENGDTSFPGKGKLRPEDERIKALDVKSTFKSLMEFYSGGNSWLGRRVILGDLASPKRAALNYEALPSTA